MVAPISLWIRLCDPVQANWFIAFPVAAGAWFDNLPPLPANNRKFSAGDLHITVAFLGGVSETAARAAWAALPELPPPTTARLGAVHGMGNPKEPSAWSAMIEADRLAETIGRLRDPAFAASQARPDSRPPLAHMTVARPDRRASNRERNAGAAWARGVRLHGVEIRISEIALYTWAQDRSDHLFDIVERRALV